MHWLSSLDKTTTFVHGSLILALLPHNWSRTLEACHVHYHFVAAAQSYVQVTHVSKCAENNLDWYRQVVKKLY